MGWSLRLGRIFGIDLKVHYTFALILIWGAFNYGGSAGPLYGLIVTLALFTLVLLHEMGHSLAALGYGIPVKDITLLPIGGVARLERMPEKPFRELVVDLAGPAVAADSHSLIDAVGIQGHDVVDFVGETARFGNDTDGAGTEQFRSDDIIDLPCRVADFEASGLDAANRSGTDDRFAIFLLYL